MTTPAMPFSNRAAPLGVAANCRHLCILAPSFCSSASALPLRLGEVGVPTILGVAAHFLGKQPPPMRAVTRGADKSALVNKQQNPVHP